MGADRGAHCACDLTDVHYYDPYNVTLDASRDVWQPGTTATAPAAA